MIAPKTGTKSAGRTSRGNAARIAAWGVALVAVVVGVAISLSSRNSEDGQEEKDVPKRKIAVARHTISKAEAVPRKPVKAKSVEEALENIGELDLPEVPVAEEPVYIEKYTNRYFKTGVEQVMGWVFTCPVGNMPPPLPTLSEEDRENLAAILLSRNEIKDGDDEAAIDAKETVDFAKKEMSRFIREGGDPQEFMEYYHAELRRANDYRCLIVDQAEAIYEDDPDLRQDFIDKVNEKLDEQGIRRVSISDFE